MNTQFAITEVREPAYFCSRCGKPLSNPDSVNAGMGPVCRGHKKPVGMSEDGGQFVDVFLNVSMDKGVLLTRPDEVNPVGTNVPHLVVAHSPSGFEFGYGGSGPADLALNIVEYYLRNDLDFDGPSTPGFEGYGQHFDLSWRLHQDFKFAFIAPMDRDGGFIPKQRVIAWIKEKMEGIDTQDHLE